MSGGLSKTLIFGVSQKHMELTKFEVGRPFPLPVPPQEGAHMELWSDGLILAIQFPGLKGQELKAFKKGLRKYSYWESNTDAPIATWVFEFPKPFNQVDCTFNACHKALKSEYLTNYLELEDGQVKNALTSFLLDGQILKGMKLIGLEPEAVELFHATIRKQLDMNFSQIEFDRSLREIYQYPTATLFERGTQFTMPKEKKL